MTAAAATYASRAVRACDAVRATCSTAPSRSFTFRLPPLRVARPKVHALFGGGRRAHILKAV